MILASTGSMSFFYKLKSAQWYLIFMSNKNRDIWKVRHNVFDLFTLRTIDKLASKGVFDELKSAVSLGKEANIFTARRGTELVCVKIYRLESCDFKKMYDYIRQDVRFQDLKHQKRQVIFAWTQREYRNLMKMREAGISAPTPIAFLNHVLVMEFIGEGDVPAQKLKDFLPENSVHFFSLVLKEMQQLWKQQMVHGDLSHYNILNHNEKPIFIDFSHSTTKQSPIYTELWQRDIKTIAQFFAKQRVTIDAAQLQRQIRSPSKDQKERQAP